MNTQTIGKITERGQITLPHKIRHSKAFAHAQAVVFVAEGDSVRVTPLKNATPITEAVLILNATLGDWSDPVNDDLFDVPALS